MNWEIIIVAIMAFAGGYGWAAMIYETKLTNALAEQRERADAERKLSTAKLLDTYELLKSSQGRAGAG